MWAMRCSFMRTILQCHGRVEDLNSIMLLEATRITRFVGDREILSGLTFQLQPEDVLFVRGPSGVGKTLLLRALACLDPLQVSAGPCWKCLIHGSNDQPSLSVQLNLWLARPCKAYILNKLQVLSRNFSSGKVCTHISMSYVCRRVHCYWTARPQTK